VSAPPEDRPGALARLDRRVVPRLQRGARATASALGAPFRLVARAEERAFPGLVRRVAPAWRVPALVAAVIVVLASAVHLQRYPELREAEREAAAGDQDPSVPAPGRGEVDPLGVSPRAVGPARGDDVAAYVAEREVALAELPGDATTVAVVSLSEYTVAEEAVELLPADVEVLRVQYRIPAEGERPQETAVAPGDVVGSVEAAIQEAVGPIVEEIEEVETLLASGTVEDPSFEADLERRLSELRAVRNLLEAAPAVVFAIVVEGSVNELRALAASQRVRLVDPAPPGADLDGTAFYGLLPEDRDRASFGSAN
jgi:hypothetical protein